MRDIGDELREVKKEILESRNLMIKADNLIRNLHVEVKEIAKKQASSHKKQILNSVFVYLLFVALISVAAYFLVNIRVTKLTKENTKLTKDANRLKSRVTELETRAKVREQASSSGLAIFRKLRHAAAEVPIAEYRSVAKDLTELERFVLAELVVQRRLELGKNFFELGLTEAKKRKVNHEKAERLFKKALRYLKGSKSKIIAELYFYLGYSLHKLKKYEESTNFLVWMIRRSTDKKRNSNAYYHIILNYSQSGHTKKAKEYFLKFYEYAPRNRLLFKARKIIGKLTP